MHEAVATSHEHGYAIYFWVWGGLLFLTAAEVLLAYNQVFPPRQMLIALLILSVIKAAMIIAWFMHLKFEARVMKWTLMSALVICLTLMVTFFADSLRILSLGIR